MDNNPTNQQSKLIKLFSALMITVALGILGAYGFNQYQDRQNSDVETTQQEEVAQESVELIIDYGGAAEVDTFQAVPVTSGMSVFEVLETAAEENDFELDYTDYGSELGVFVEGINGYFGGDGEWWQFWVNGEYQTVGMSGVTVSDGDTIEIKLSGE